MLTHDRLVCTVLPGLRVKLLTEGKWCTAAGPALAWHGHARTHRLSKDIVRANEGQPAFLKFFSLSFGSDFTA